MKQFQITLLSSMNYFLKDSYDGILHLGLLSFWNLLILQYSKNNKIFQKLDLFLPHMKGRQELSERGLWEVSYMPGHKISLHVWCAPSQSPIFMKIPARNVANFLHA